MKNFRLPRKTKKRLMKGFWLYPEDEEENSTMAFPWRSKEDYMALKRGLLRDLFNQKNSKIKRKETKEKLDREVIVTDEQLRNYIDALIKEDLRIHSYNILLQARSNPDSIRVYYNFVNAYQLYQNGDESMGNICCMAIDLAKDLIRKKRTKKQ
ncbi:MAG: hypothetical protein JXA03_16775 [Bacteroidales bacterium]|nr:hypothetical protein [Bacteroidales bacterium]